MLERYHSYKLPKKAVKQYQTLASAYGLTYNPKSVADYLRLSVFETGLTQKKTIETVYESVRNAHYDMWEHLSFYERNDIIKMELDPQLEAMKSFKTETADIVIPFFDPLMNALYCKEVAILELPQFFHLYTDFRSKITPIDSYGIQPYVANMSIFSAIASTAEVVVLHSPEIHAFVRIGSTCEVFPYYKNTILVESEILALSTILCESYDLFVARMVDKQFVSRRFIRHYRKTKERTT